jgi:hypothetical protein
MYGNTGATEESGKEFLGERKKETTSSPSVNDTRLLCLSLAFSTLNSFVNGHWLPSNLINSITILIGT